MRKVILVVNRQIKNYTKTPSVRHRTFLCTISAPCLWKVIERSKLRLRNRRVVASSYMCDMNACACGLHRPGLRIGIDSSMAIGLASPTNKTAVRMGFFS